MTVRFAADSPAVAHGLGLFETLRVIGGQAFDLREHYQRMASSAATLGFPVPMERAFGDAVRRALRRPDPTASAFRRPDPNVHFRRPDPNVDFRRPDPDVEDPNKAFRRPDPTAECAVRCLYAEDTGRWRLVATTFPIPATTLRRRKGARVITLDRSLVRALPQHKLTSYAVSILGLRQAVDAGADEALFVDRRGRVLEGTTTNVFAIDGETLITARDGVLPGIVRAWVIEHASRVVYRPPTVDELRNGSFLTGSLTGLAPIVTIDGVRCAAPGAAFARLRAVQ